MATNKFIVLGNLELVLGGNDNSLIEANEKIRELSDEIIALKEQIAKIKTATTEPSLPSGYVWAKDSDFEWETDYPWYGAWHYVGTADKVAIPHTIQGKELTSYRGMFYKTSVSGVYSDNKNITNMSFMFHISKATSLDLSHLDTSGVTDMRWMLADSMAKTLDLSSFDTSNITNKLYMSTMVYNSKAKKVYVRTLGEAYKFKRFLELASQITFVVKP